jgi:hypothetical protein
MLNGPDLFGSTAEPPGNVMVKTEPGATASGATKPTVTSCDCEISPAGSVAVHATALNSFEIVCSAPAGPPIGIKNTSNAATAPPRITKRLR